MEITGIILQLVAGLLLALPYVFPNDWFISLDEKIKNLIKLPLSKNRRFVLFPIFASLFIVCGYFGFSIFIQNEPQLQWYDKTLLILFYSSASAFLYMYFVLRLLKIFFSSRLSLFSSDKPYWTYIIVNLITLVVFLIVVIFSFSCLKALAQNLDIATNIIRILHGTAIHLLIQILGFTSLAFLYSCIFLIILILFLILAAIASPIKKPLWGIVVFLYLVGGLLLLFNALSVQ